jgi:predicted ATPase
LPTLIKEIMKMEENFNNKISRLELENFTCFAKAEMDFSSGINVFIGENGTGKTHILKAIYALLYDNSNDSFLPPPNVESVEISGHSNASLHSQYFDRILSHLLSYFRPEGEQYQRLIRKHEDDENKLKAKLIFGTNHFTFQIIKSHNEPHNFNLPWESSQKFHFYDDSIFIPSNEMLTLYRGFISAYEKRENSFDGTHYNLAKALDLLPLKKQALNGSEILLEAFNKEVGIQVYKKDGQFYLKFKDGVEVEAPLAAEGLKKLAQMIYLIQNGSLNKDTILFWDEPETNLNPKYIKIVAKFLQVLAKNGVQIFVATHDYLLTNLLSLSAEYPKKDTPPMRFFSLSKGENGTEIEFADTIHGIQNNAILDEFADYSELMLNSQIQKLQNA